MKDLLKLLLFILYTLSIFIVKNPIWIVISMIINLISMYIFKVNIKKAIIGLLKISILIIVTVIFNILLVNIETAISIGIKLLLVYNITYTFSNILTYTSLANAIEILMYPIKIFGVNPKDIGLLVCMAIAFIPILSDEINQIKNVLIVKGFDLRFSNIIKNLNLILKPFFISLLQRVSELEISLKSKAYQE